MRQIAKCALVALALLLCLIPQQSAGEKPSVDYRIAPLEQVKKIHALAKTGNDKGPTVTVMALGMQSEAGELSHMIVDDSLISPSYLQSQLALGFSSISWTDDDGAFTQGACDSQQECEDRTDELCEDAGHGGVKNVTVKITIHSDGSKTCSGNCENNGAIAFVTCGHQMNCVACL